MFGVTRSASRSASRLRDSEQELPAETALSAVAT